MKKENIWLLVIYKKISVFPSFQQFKENNLP